MEKQIPRMKGLTVILSEVGKAYYQESREIMSNFKYDRLYDELMALKKESGVVLSGSPTQKIGYEVLSELPKEAHPSAMLSLDKTKDVAALQEWLGGQEGLLSWKLDGLTIALTYEGGELSKAVTRGNGEISEVITNNARMSDNIPLKTAFDGTLVLRGGAMIKYSDFNKTNEEIEDADAKYENPRNLCSGSMRQLNNQTTAEKYVNFEAFALMSMDGVDFHSSRSWRFAWLQELGFDVVEHQKVTRETLPEKVTCLAEATGSYDVPSGGLVLTFEDIAYGESLGRTAKFPRNSIAFKWADEIRETKPRYIGWSPSRTGLINPVTVFESVELEGSTMSRASVHNLSILESLALGEGDTIMVYKVNMIIPQIADSPTRSSVSHVPEMCLVCGEATAMSQVNDAKALYCTNPDCQAKKIKGFTLLVSRDTLNIDGLSEATLEKFIGAGFIKEYSGMSRLDRYKEEITQIEGFREKSYENLIQSVETASFTILPRVIYGLGITGIELTNAKMLCRASGCDLEKMRHADEESLMAVDGVGKVLADAWIQYFRNEENNRLVDNLMAELTVEVQENREGAAIFEGMTFVTTGSVEHFANREELQEVIEARGGKTAGLVSAKTTYLINNDVAFNSSKNKKARELRIPALSEEDSLELLEQE